MLYPNKKSPQKSKSISNSSLLECSDQRQCLAYSEQSRWYEKKKIMKNIPLLFVLFPSLLVSVHHANALHFQRNDPLELLSIQTRAVGQAPQTLDFRGDVLSHSVLNM